MPLRRSILIVLFLALFGAGCSLLLLLEHYNQAHDNVLVSMMCGSSSTGGCTAVDESPYASFFGVPLSAYGLIFYLALALLAGLSFAAETKAQEEAASVLWILSAFAVLVDVALFLVQALIIGAFCTLCLSTYAVSLLIAVLLLKYRSFAPLRHVRALLGLPAGKMLAGAWVGGLVLLAVGVWTSNLALSLIDPTTFDERLADIAYGEFHSSPAVSIDVAETPSVGLADAPIKIVVFSDFLCPWCKQVADIFQQNFPKWNDKVVVYYKSFPLDKFCNPSIGKTVHPGSCWMALGGVCAAEQGKFWEYHDQVYGDQPKNPSSPTVMRIAAQAGIDTVALKQCMMQTKNQGKVRSLITQAASLGVLGTPVIFINGHRLPRIAYFSYVLRKEAEHLGLPPLEGLED